MDVPEETMEQMRAVKAALDDLEQHMQPFPEAAPKQITQQLTPLERVKVHLALAQSVVTLYQLHRKLAAAKMDNHPLQKELERLAAYEKKVKKAVTADDLARNRPGTSLNIAAANRFIDAAIPDLSQEQKQALRTLGKRAREEAQGPAAAAAAAAVGVESSRKGRKGAKGSERHHQQQRQQQEQQQRGSDSRGDGGGGDSDVDSDEQQQRQQQQCLGVKGAGKAAVEEEAAELLREVLAET